MKLEQIINAISGHWKAYDAKNTLVAERFYLSADKYLNCEVRCIDGLDDGVIGIWLK